MKTYTNTTMPKTTEECKRCLFTEEFAKIHEDGECEYCKLQDKLANQATGWPLVLDEVRDAGKDDQYDCLMGISGGADSSVLLYLAVKVWGLRPLVIHLDNRWNLDIAQNNMKVITEHLNVPLIVYYPDKKEYDDLNDAFLKAGLPDADIPNDIAMTKLSYDTAAKYGIKYLLLGHDLRREGSTPAKWTYMDAKYIQSVYNKWTGKRLKNYPLFTFWDQIRYGFKGIKQVRPFHYGDFDREKILKELRAIGWKDYEAKHCENIYTEFVGSYLLPRKFGIDKRMVYYSAQIRSGLMLKGKAKQLMSEQVNFNLDKLGERKAEILKLTLSPLGKRSDYDRYNFKRWKIVIWLLAVLKVVPFSFYAKYTK
jgi:tRNA(Ile)-lysidine synthase TilS/MesJ